MNPRQKVTVFKCLVNPNKIYTLNIINYVCTYLDAPFVSLDKEVGAMYRTCIEHGSVDRSISNIKSNWAKIN